MRVALENTNNPKFTTSYGINNGSGEVADDELSMIPTIEEVDDGEQV